MTQSPLLTHILARRPWLADIEAVSSFGFTSSTVSLDPAAAQRLIDAYLRAEQECPADFRPNDVWRQFVERHYGDMLKLIHAGDATALAAYLQALPRQGGGHGYFQGRAAWQALHDQPEHQRERAIWLADHLAGFAESLGLLRERCPEQGEWQRPAFTDVAQLCAELERALGMPVTLPALFDGMFVLAPQHAPCHLRSLMPAYALDQLRRFFALHARREVTQLRVAEIGAGIGHTAYLAAHLGMARYSIFDLPEINVAQGYFLMASVGADKVRLLGEPSGPALEVLPPWAYEPTLQQGYDAVLNIDSMPEIARDATQRYLEGMAGCADYFFSLNQEAPRPDPVQGERAAVRAMVEAHTDFVPLQRNRNWLRAGYVDEVFGLRAR